MWNTLREVPHSVQYCDAIRLGDLELFKAIEKESTGWWTAELDRGAGSLLHIAVDHGQVGYPVIITNVQGGEQSLRSALDRTPNST